MHIVTELAVQTPHEKDYVARRSYKEEEALWIIICCSNTCMIETRDGLQEAHAGDCFIKSPEFIEYHYTPEYCTEGFINDWMHIRSDAMGRTLTELQLPTNTIIKTQHPEIMRNSAQRIINEKRNMLPYSDLYIHNLVDHILIKIARAAVESCSSASRKYEEDLLRLRLELQNHLSRQWSIREMSEFIGLSSSRLSVLYKNRFELSPNEDLIQMRIDKAKILLLSTNMKLHQISQLCGFKNEYYFSRVFKEREKITPGAYRRWE